MDRSTPKARPESHATEAEEARLDALRQYRVLDTAADVAFDDLARLAAAICETPIALITLVDRDRQWFKSHVGLDRTETPRADAFCDITILGTEPLVVPDTREDPRFADSPFVIGEPKIRFYTGAPLVTPGGYAVGAISVIDRVPRTIAAGQVDALAALARQVVVLLEFRRNAAELVSGTEALRWSESRYRDLVDTSYDLIWSVDLDGRITFVNKSSKRIYGYEPAEMIGRPYTDFVAPERLAADAETFARLLAGEAVPSYETVHRRKDGAAVTLSLRSALLRDEGGAVCGITGSATDTTQQRAAEARLREQTRTVETIHRVSAALAAELDRERLVQLLTDEATALTGAHFGAFFDTAEGEAGRSYPVYTLSGAPREAFAGFPSPRPTEIFGPTFRGEGIVRIDDVTKDPRYGKNLPYRGMPDGHLPVRSYLAVPVRSRTGELLGALFFGHPEPGVFTPWHERIVSATAAQAAVALDNARLYDETRRAEKRFRLLIDNATDIVSVLGADGTIRYESPSVERILGYAPDELVGRNCLDLIHPDDAGTIADILRAGVVARGVAAPVEYRFRHKDGSWRTLESIADNLLDEPSIAGVVVNTRDVTDRRTAEEALRRSEEELRQSQKMQAIGRLAGGIAHDFNNVLTVIGGYSEMMSRRLSPHDPLYRESEEIRKAARRAASLTRQLLAFSRGQVLQPKIVDVNALVAGVEQMLRRVIGEDVALVTELDPEPGRVRVDPGQLEQVIVNLVVNARDAMPAGGTVTIETRNAPHAHGAAADAGDAADGFVTLTVRDTGTGMDAETLDHIFEPFYTTKEVGKGTGLGLAVVYAIVHRSGGTVEVESRTGGGSEFRVLLPRVGEETSPDETPSGSNPPAPGGETVLLAEDEDAVRQLIAAALRSIGYEVLEARDGREALDALERHAGDVHLLVTDVVMPTMGGPELVERVGARSPRTRVLYISGYAESEAVAQSVAEGRAALLSKPFTPDQIARAVRAVLDGHDVRAE
jgi:PAS domain S-box-containing protein